MTRPRRTPPCRSSLRSPSATASPTGSSSPTPAWCRPPTWPSSTPPGCGSSSGPARPRRPATWPRTSVGTATTSVTADHRHHHAWNRPRSARQQPGTQGRAGLGATSPPRAAPNATTTRPARITSTTSSSTPASTSPSSPRCPAGARAGAPARSWVASSCTSLPVGRIPAGGRVERRTAVPWRRSSEPVSASPTVTCAPSCLAAQAWRHRGRDHPDPARHRPSECRGAFPERCRHHPVLAHSLGEPAPADRLYHEGPSAAG